jgi:Crp-like helix-turn-helix domain
MNDSKSVSLNEVDQLRGIKALGWLSGEQIRQLANSLALANFRRREIIARGEALTAHALILLAGIARITCMSARNERITVALIAPGPIPVFPSHQVSHFSFQCEAYNDCRVGSVEWQALSAIGSDAKEQPVHKFHQNDLKQWYRLLLRSSSFLTLSLHERIAIALLELCSDFGIEESHGTILKIALSHKEIANLVGASRPGVTEHLARLEREQLVIRQGRQLLVRVPKLHDWLGVSSAYAA